MKQAMKQAMQVLTSRETVDWYTPPPYIEMVRAVLGDIDLDPASAALPQSWIKARQWYGLDLSDFHPDPMWDARRYQLELRRLSLRQLAAQPRWEGRVFLNAPFDATATWMNRMEREYAPGSMESGVALVNSNLGYAWYEKLWRRWPVCCAEERICFIREDGTPGGQAKRGQTFAYLGMDYRRFIDVFSPIGRILLP